MYIIGVPFIVHPHNLLCCCVQIINETFHFDMLVPSHYCIMLTSECTMPFWLKALSCLVPKVRFLSTNLAFQSPGSTISDYAGSPCSRSPSHAHSGFSQAPRIPCGRPWRYSLLCKACHELDWHGKHFRSACSCRLCGLQMATVSLHVREGRIDDAEPFLSGRGEL